MAQTADGEVIGEFPANINVIGSGGFVTGGDIADDGTIVARCDSTGPVIRGPGATEWSRLFKPGINMLDASKLDIAYGANYDPGTYDVAICATNAMAAYFVVQGYVWKTTDGGATVTRTALAQKAGCLSNQAARTTGKPLAVDPENGNVVFFGAPDGLHYTLDGGANWTSVSTGTIPAPTSGQRMIVAFDRSVAPSGGRILTIYVFVNGSGLYVTEDGGATWAEIEDVPEPATSAGHMRVGPSNGYVHLSSTGEGGNGPYRRWDTSSWITPTMPSGGDFKSIAISTINDGRMWNVGNGGHIRVSTDHGENWGSFGAPVRVATDNPWMAWTDEEFMANGDILFDPDSGALWMLEGIGAWKNASPPSTISGDVTWTEASKGIENMVTTLVDVSPGGTVLYACHDRIGFVRSKLLAGVAFASVHATSELADDAIDHGGNIDFAPEDETFLVSPVYGLNSIYSEDGGNTWQDMPGDIRTASGGIGGGNIVALSKTCFVQMETGNSGKLMYTLDGGTTWAQLALTGDVVLHGTHNAYTLHRRILVKDQHVANQCYLYAVVDGAVDANNLAARGIWRINYSGGSFTTTRVKSSYITNSSSDFYNGKFRQYGANDWLWVGGDGCLGLWRSTDGMANFAELTGTDDVTAATKFGEVLAVAVGMGVSASAPKAVWAIGHRQVSPAHATNYSGFGLWLSVDGMVTWTRIEQFPGGYFNMVTDLAADPTEFGLLYIGQKGEGLTKLSYADARAFS